MDKLKIMAHKICFQIVYILKLLIPEEGMSSLASKTILSKFYGKQQAVFNQKVNYAIEYDLMVIVPVYNSAAYLEKCLESLVNQKTRYTYKIICVDDGSTDHSKIILQQYRNVPNIEIIYKKNGGVASARNKALENICGQYVLFVDSDDILPQYAIEVLMNAAVKNGADIVEGAYKEFVEDEEIDICIHKFKEEKKQMNGYPWGKVINAKKMKNLCFPDGFQYEDTIITMLLLPSCKINIKLADVTYYYRKNLEGITETIVNKKQSLDTYYMTRYCLDEMTRRGYICDLSVFLNQVRLNWMRTQNMPDNIQKAIFIEEAELLKKYFAKKKYSIKGNLRKIQKVLRRQKYSAYIYLMNYWYI